MDSIICSEEGAEAANEGEGAAWWEAWDVEDAPARKRKHPTSKPTAEDAQEDHRLASLSLQVLLLFSFLRSSLRYLSHTYGNMDVCHVR